MAYVQWVRELQGPFRFRWRDGLLWGLVVCGWLWAEGAVAAPIDEVIPIGSITVNPMANNRRAVVLKGKAKTVNGYQGQDSLGYSICGQGFILEDDSGSLDVLYLVRCQGNETPTAIGEGERVVVFATIDVSSSSVKNSEGKELLVKAMATKIVRDK